MSIEIAEIAQELKEGAAGKLYCAREYPQIDGVSYSFPWQEIEGAPYDMIFPSEVFEMYGAMKELMVDTPLPEPWREVIKEAGQLAQQNGIEEPVDIIHAAYFTMVENPERVQKIGAQPFKESENFGPDFRDKKTVKQCVDTCTNDPVLREKLIQTASVQIPDNSQGWLNMEVVAKVVNQKPSILVDIGCGVGYQTEEKATQIPQACVIGLDRQFHKRWYTPWQEQNGASFVRADAAKGLPFKNDSIDYATLEFVAEHVTEKALSQILTEALRVLKPNGILFVGPQFCGWATYKKTAENNEIRFEQTDLESL